MTEAKVQQFLDCLRSEWQRLDEFLTPQEVDVLRYDCRSPAQEFANFDDKQRERYLRGFLRFERSWLALEARAVLDAGCGTGTWSFLWGLLGNDVLGVDLQSTRLSVACKRLTFWETELLKRPLPVRFETGNLFNLPEDVAFDTVFLREAISHIHPAEDFLRFIWQRLPSGGQLIISEQNGWWIPEAVRLFRERGYRLRLIVVKQDPGIQQPVPYAVERVFGTGSVQWDFGKEHQITSKGPQKGISTGQNRCIIWSKSWLWPADGAIPPNGPSAGCSHSQGFAAPCVELVLR